MEVPIGTPRTLATVNPVNIMETVIIFPAINMPIKVSMSGYLENRLNNAVKIGVPIAKVRAKAVTREPATEIAIFISVATSDNNPTITNSLVPRTKVNKNKFNVKSFCCLVNRYSFLSDPECKSYFCDNLLLRLTATKIAYQSLYRKYKLLPAPRDPLCPIKPRSRDIVCLTRPITPVHFRRLQ